MGHNPWSLVQQLSSSIQTDAGPGESDNLMQYLTTRLGSAAQYNFRAPQERGAPSQQDPQREEPRHVSPAPHKSLTLIPVLIQIST